MKNKPILFTCRNGIEKIIRKQYSNYKCIIYCNNKTKPLLYIMLQFIYIQCVCNVNVKRILFVYN